MKKIIFYIILTTSITSCASKNIFTQEKNHNNIHQLTEDNNAFFTNIQRPSFFDAVKISSKITVEIGEPIPPLNAIFYIENNQKIWINITALLGLTGARGLATPKGIKAYEKINKTYIDSDFMYLNNLLGVNFINYEVLQNFLIGRTPIPVNNTDFILSQTTNGYNLKSLKIQELIVNNKISTYNINLDYDNMFNLIRVKINDGSSNNQIEVNYSDWIKINDETFPKKVKIIIKNKKNNQFLIENTTFDFSRVNTPYSVPSNYTKKEIK